jgi:hypothetical protein
LFKVACNDVSARVPTLPGGYKPGQTLVYTGSNRRFDNGDVLVQGRRGTVMGPFGERLHMGFPGNRASVVCHLQSLKAEPPEECSLPCGFGVDDRVFFVGRSVGTPPRRVVYGQAGRVALRLESDGSYVVVEFDTLLSTCRMDELSSERPPPMPGGHEPDEELVYLGSKAWKVPRPGSNVHDLVKYGAVGRAIGPCDRRSVHFEVSPFGTVVIVDASELKPRACLEDAVRAADEAAKNLLQEEEATTKDDGSAQRSRKKGKKKRKKTKTRNQEDGRKKCNAETHESDEEQERDDRQEGDNGDDAREGCDDPLFATLEQASLVALRASTEPAEPAESSAGGETTCIVCFTLPKSHLAVPCGHRCACEKCAQQMLHCPVCRAAASLWVHVRDV